MTQIKSEKAECLLNAAKQSNINGCPVSFGIATKAVIQAEQEARGRAVNAFCGSHCENCPGNESFVCSPLAAFLKHYDNE